MSTYSRLGCEPQIDSQVLQFKKRVPECSGDNGIRERIGRSKRGQNPWRVRVSLIQHWFDRLDEESSRVSERFLRHRSFESSGKGSLNVCHQGSRVVCSMLGRRSRLDRDNPPRQSLDKVDTHLHVIKLAIKTVLLQQVLMGTAFHQVALIKNKNQINMPNGRQPVSNHKGRPSDRKPVER